MNKTDLMKDLYKMLKESGWLDRATEHFREHPEYFEQSNHGYIAELRLSVSFQPNTLLEVPEVSPNIFVELYNGGIWNNLSIFATTGYICTNTMVKNNDYLEDVTKRQIHDI